MISLISWLMYSQARWPFTYGFNFYIYFQCTLIKWDFNFMKARPFSFCISLAFSNIIFFIEKVCFSRLNRYSRPIWLGLCRISAYSNLLKLNSTFSSLLIEELKCENATTWLDRPSEGFILLILMRVSKTLLFICGKRDSMAGSRIKELLRSRIMRAEE